MSKKIIKTIDLWTEQKKNHYECFNGAFVDGFSDDTYPFDRYIIIKNCNCKISVSLKGINISNKHNAIVFYKNDIPSRLMVINKDTDIEKCVEVALSQFFEGEPLKTLFDKINIDCNTIDMKMSPIYNDLSILDEIDTGSCDRWNLLYSMLKGSYTESDTSYGNFDSDRYEFLPDIKIVYDLETRNEHFIISHSSAFINNLKTRIIPIQDDSPLTSK